jgi:aspartyl-tRNA(Asn)/glutamyl-tRNA(Gln) amidotransferase subunit B
MAAMNERNKTISEIGVSAASLAQLLKMIEDQAISGKIAKDVLIEMIETKNTPKDIVSSKGLSQISDKGAIEQAVEDVLARNEKSAADYRNGKKTAMTFLIGQVMKETKGKANPALVNEILKKKLEG